MARKKMAKQPREKLRTCSFRLSPVTIAKLDALTGGENYGRTKALIRCIDEQYSRDFKPAQPARKR